MIKLLHDALIAGCEKAKYLAEKQKERMLNHKSLYRITKSL